MVKPRGPFDPDSAPRGGGSLPLFDLARARCSDPSTSSEAAHRMNRTGLASRHVTWILDALEWRDGMTASEIAARIEAVTGDRWDNVMVSRRLSAMDDAGQIHRDGRRGREQIVWLGRKA